jgi:putative endonuclease
MKSQKYYFVYILTNKRNGTLYVGLSKNVLNRSFQHKIKLNKNSFSAKYDLTKLVYYETYADIIAAITREKQLKKWRREWKIALIEKDNSVWKDLFYDL